jgi:hypothetical protein
MPASIRPVAAISLSLWLAACNWYGPCDQQRGIELYATVNGRDVREADQTDPLSMVAFWEHQRDGFLRDVSWTILAPRLPGTATEVQLRQGSVLLYTIPIENARRDLPPRPGQPSDSVLDQITAGLVEAYGSGPPGSWYRGTVPIEELMQRLYRDSTYIEVITDSVPAGAFRAGLGRPRFLGAPEDPARWQPVYCS